MDKQIVLDGVDVRGCEFATKAEMVCDTHCRLYDYDYCIGKECYYKQLKRKEQECDMWKNLTVDNGAVALKYQQQLDQLKAENDTLKQYKASKQASYESMQREWNQAVNENRELKADNKHLNDLLNQALKENEELQQLKDEDSLRVTRLAMENTLLQKKFEESEYARGNELIKLVGSKTQIEAYKQVVKKVRELCQKDKDFCVSCEGDGNIDCIDCTEGGKAKLAVQILRICDEVNDVY